MDIKPLILRRVLEPLSPSVLAPAGEVNKYEKVLGSGPLHRSRKVTPNGSN